jgi:hypothetical protein
MLLEFLQIAAVPVRIRRRKRDASLARNFFRNPAMKPPLILNAPSRSIAVRALASLSRMPSGC